MLKPQESGGTDDVFVAMPGDDWQAHVEVMITADGPRLIEIGARLAGAGAKESQITRMVRHRADGDTSVGTYSQQKYVTSVYLSSPRAGVLRNATELGSLVRYGEGSVVPRTDDLWTSLGYVVLVSTDLSQLGTRCGWGA